MRLKVQLDMGKITKIAIVVVAIVLTAALVMVIVWGPKNAAKSTTDSRCIITLFGHQYDVTEFRKIHKGGNVFICGTDMTQQYIQQHGNTPDRVNQYLTPL